MRRFGPAFLIVIPLVVLVAWHRHGEHHPFRLAEPRPASISELGRVAGPKPHDCRDDEGYQPFGACYVYVGGWCQAPCTPYRVRGTVVSIRRLDAWTTLWKVVLRDQGSEIVARTLSKPRARVGSRVTVAGVLFFPHPPRDGRHARNGAELSPVLSAL